VSEDPRARDAEARRLAQTEFHRPLVLEAGAGTGKTAALVARVVAWSLGDGWERQARRLAEAGEDPTPESVAPRVLRRIVAITFTEAAAAEMASRVGRALVELERGELPIGLLADALEADGELRRERTRALLGALDQLSVRTIHAFCRRLLAEHPLEAGLHPHFEVDADESRARSIAREVMEDALPALVRDSAELRLLAERRLGPPALEEALLGLLRDGVPPEALAADPLAPERVAELFASLAGALDGFLALEAGRLAGLRRAPKVVATVERLGRLRERLARTAADREGLEALLEWVAADENAVDGSYPAKWVRGDFSKGGLDALGADAGALAARAFPLARALAHFVALDPPLLDAARRLLEPLLAAAWRRLRGAGVETFPMLLRDARDLLATRPDVTRRVRARIDQLLVDEFQDTDRMQCALVRALVLDAPEAERPGLFLVGDPKQSIYGWRDAELGAYDDFVAEVERAGGRREPLVVNHRSAPAILDEVERLVAPVMLRAPGLQPAFEPLLAAPERADDPGFAEPGFAPVEHWVSWRFDREAGAPALTRAGEAAELEARALARDLVRLRREHGVAWSEVALLFRGATDLETYLGALRAAEIPFAVDGDRSYYRRREIIEASALVRCVLDPGDALALVTLLRSAAVGVPDAALVPLWARELPARIAALHAPDAAALEAIGKLVIDSLGDVPRDVPGIERVDGWDRNLLAAVSALAVLRRSFEDDPADAFVEKLRGLFAFELTEAARWLGPYRVANLDRFFRELVEALRDADGDPQAVLRRLRSEVAERRDAAEGRPKEAIEDAVRVLTIHKAKGLDFGHVYVLQLHKGRGRGNEELRAEEVADGRFEYALLGAPTLGCDALRARREAVEENERVRTLYVALTRAKRRLVVAGARPGTGARASNETHVALLAKRRGGTPDLDAAMAALAARDETALDEAGARWVFPGLAPDGEPPRAGDERRPCAEPAAVRAAAEALAARRGEAEAAATRSFHAPVSARSHESAQDDRREGRGGDEAGEEAAAPPRGGRVGAASDVAAAVGSAVHRALERIDLAAEPAAELARLRSGLAEDLVHALPERERAEALARADALLARFAAGALGARLRGLAPHVVARELPVLLPPDPADPDAPAGFLAGRIDLLYRDPDTGEWVVADYKTDALDGEEALAERARFHAAQGAGYLRAVREALRLDRDPRFELWFLEADRMVEARVG
jgi:ATP-dependent helicase/nuclease subunit A